jgi:hypothetical protein
MARRAAYAAVIGVHPLFVQVSYLSVPNYGAGTGLYSIDQDLKMEKIANHSSVFANRIIHHWTSQVISYPSQFLCVLCCGGIHTVKLSSD